MTNVRSASGLILAAITLARIAPAQAFPYLTVTVFGDRPALEHVAKPLAGKDLIGNGGLGRATPKTDAEPPRAVVPAAQTPVSVQTYIPGMRVKSAPSTDSMPLATLSTVRSLDDTRLIDEADSQLSVENYAPTPAPSSTEPADESEIAEAVREAAEAARAQRVDRSMQGEVEAELDDDLQLIEFGEIESSQVTELTEDDAGVLGLVSVTDVVDDDDVVVDESGRLVTVKDNDDEDDLVQWQADVFGEVPGVANSVASINGALAGDGLSANRTLLQRMTSLSQTGGKGAGIVSAQQMAELSTTHAIANVDAFAARLAQSSGRATEKKDPLSMEVLIAFVMSILTSGQAYASLGVLALIGLVLRRLSRTAGARA